MTPGYGIGMLAIGLLAIAIGGFIAFYIINEVGKDDEEECIDPWYRNKRGGLARGGCWGESSGSFSCAVFGRGATGASIFTKNKYVGIRMVRNV